MAHGRASVWASVLLVLASGVVAEAQSPRNLMVGRTGVLDLVVYEPMMAGFSLEQTLRELTRAVSAPIGFEALPSAADGAGSSTTGARVGRRIVLTGMRLGDALDVLVRIDSRYEWKEANGIIALRPKGASTDPENPLNRPVPSFYVISADMDALATAIHRQFDSRWTPPGGTPWLASPISPTAAPAAAAWLRRPVSMKVVDTTVFGVLNAVCATHGDVSWTVRYSGSEARWPQARLRFVPRAGLAVVTSFTPLPAVPATPSPAVPIYLDLPVIPHRLHATLRALNRMGVVRAGLELVPAPDRIGLPIDPGEARVALVDQSPDQMLWRIMAEAAPYESFEDSGLLNIAPKGARLDPRSPLNRRFKQFEVKDVTLGRLGDELQALFGIRVPERRPDINTVIVPPPAGFTGTERDSIEQQQRGRMAEATRTITLSLRNATLRQILNAIMAARDDVMWTVAFVGERPDRMSLQIILDAHWSSYSTMVPPDAWR